MDFDEDPTSSSRLFDTDISPEPEVGVAPEVESMLDKIGYPVYGGRTYHRGISRLSGMNRITNNKEYPDLDFGSSKKETRFWKQLVSAHMC